MCCRPEVDDLLASACADLESGLQSRNIHGIRAATRRVLSKLRDYSHAISSNPVKPPNSHLHQPELDLGS